MQQTYSVKKKSPAYLFTFEYISHLTMFMYVMILAVSMAKNYNKQFIVSVLEQQHFDCGQKKAFLKHLMSKASFRELYISFSFKYVINSESNMCL